LIFHIRKNEFLIAEESSLIAEVAMTFASVVKCEIEKFDGRITISVMLAG